MERVSGAKIAKLDDVVGPVQRARFEGRDVDWVGLPHPSGLSAWHKVEPGKSLLRVALATLGKHASFRRTFPDRAR
jgi:uracil-DNA glycosylase